jgi:hypothetical protein
MIRSTLFTSVNESSIRHISVTNIGTAETIQVKFSSFIYDVIISPLILIFFTQR